MTMKKKKIPKGLQKKFQVIAIQGINFRNILFSAGLWKTYQVMGKVLHELGYEAADIIKKKVGIK